MTERFEQLADRLAVAAGGDETDPDPSAAAVSALDARAFDLAGGAGVVAVYEFDTWDEANAFANAFDDGAPGRYRASGTNGSIAFTGAVAVEDDDDLLPVFALNDALAAVAGRE